MFDIDGTILLSSGIGRRLMDESLGALFGPQVSSREVSFSGRTDIDIMTEILQNNGFLSEDLPLLVKRALDHYDAHARDGILPSDVTLLPGVGLLLEHLQADDAVQLGLVTGNLKSTAYAKLRAAGVASKFPFGAFGSDHADRNELPALAIERAYHHTGTRFRPEHVVIVGDSVLDIRCGRHVGAYCVAVSTGYTSAARLAAEGPDLLMEDLADTKTFLRSILA